MFMTSLDTNFFDQIQPRVSVESRLRPAVVVRVINCIQSNTRVSVAEHSTSKPSPVRVSLCTVNGKPQRSGGIHEYLCPTFWSKMLASKVWYGGFQLVVFVPLSQSSSLWLTTSIWEISFVRTLPFFANHTHVQMWCVLTKATHIQCKGTWCLLSFLLTHKHQSFDVQPLYCTMAMKPQLFVLWALSHVSLPSQRFPKPCCTPKTDF